MYNAIHQQDGVLPYFALNVLKFLNDYVPRQWIGRGSETIAGLPRSLDLNSLYFLWGFNKDQV